MKLGYRHTLCASFLGYIVQAAINSFVPLLFVTFQEEYSVPLSQITLLIAFNFIVQLSVDLFSAFFVDKIGYRRAIVAAHACAAAGLALLTVLPDLIGFSGLLISVMIYAIGGGLIEVLISPIVEACPTDNKTQVMGILHSFYCWGCVAVVGLSTLFFATAGMAHWKILTLLWALLPLCNLVYFTQVPLASLVKQGERGMKISELLKNKTLWLFLVIIFCAGASEQAVSQWASAFAEQGLGVSKTVGDLLGPMLFSALMGLARVIYGKFSAKVDLRAGMIAGGALCIAAYLLIASDGPAWLGLCGMGLCGFGVGILWPATFSIASGEIPKGGTAMFALLALGGDLGCFAGPSLAGAAASANGDSLSVGILSAVFFPVLLVAALVLLVFYSKKKNSAASDGEKK